MIPLDKLQAIKHIISHKNCSDGKAAAMILHDCLPDATVEFIQYDTKEHKELVPCEGMIFADLSPDPKRVAQFVEVGAIVLDHHSKQKSIVDAFGPLGVYANTEKAPGRGGATLAYQEVWLPIMQDKDKRGLLANGIVGRQKAVDELATLAGIRDTWVRNHPRFVESSKQNEALSFWPWEHLKDLTPHQWADKLIIGDLQYDKKQKHARQCADNSHRFVTAKGTKVVVFEGVRPTSDAAEYLHTEVDLVIGFAMYPDEGRGGQLVLRFSCRSHTGWDCGAFALSFPGGGGHDASAGFVTPIYPHHPNAFRMIEDTVRAHEGEPQRDWSVTFSRYQRDNLVWLLNAVTSGVDPFALANTGDWSSEVSSLLDYERGDAEPNIDMAQLNERIVDWLSTLDNDVPPAVPPAGM